MRSEAEYSIAIHGKTWRWKFVGVFVEHRSLVDVKYNIRCGGEKTRTRSPNNAHTRAHGRNNDPYFFVSREIRSPLIECPFLFLNGFIIAPLRGVFYSYGKSGPDL